MHKHKTIKQLLPILPCIFFLFIGCKKEVSEYTDWPILEAYLHPGNYFNLKVSRQVPFISDAQYSDDDIDNLVITVICDSVTHTLIPLGSGQYIDSSLIVDPAQEFQLSLTFNAKSASAYTYIPSKPERVTQSVTSITVQKFEFGSGPPTSISMPDPVKLTWTNTDASNYLVVIENIEENPEPIFDFEDDEERPAFIFRKQPTTSTEEEIRSQEFQYFGTHRLILFHVLPDYAALYNDNNASSQNLTNPSTSIANGYGIFTGLNSDTLFLEVNEQ